MDRLSVGDDPHRLRRRQLTEILNDGLSILTIAGDVESEDAVCDDESTSLLASDGRSVRRERGSCENVKHFYRFPIPNKLLSSALWAIKKQPSKNKRQCQCEMKNDAVDGIQLVIA